MTIGEAAGYVASALVFMTFYMKMMTPLRVIAIMSNIAFVTYASIEGLLPILVLHLSLLPLNIIRLRQILKLTGQVREAAGEEYSFESVLSFMSPQSFKAGDVLFRRGDPSHDMYYINDGVIRLPELDKTVGRGETLGEIGLFSRDQTRTTTAVCETDCELLRMSEDKVQQLYFQNPRFGFQLVRIITRRLIENYSRLTQPATTEADAVVAQKAEGSMAGQGSEPAWDGQAEQSQRAGKSANNQSFRFLPIMGVAGFLIVLLISWQASPYVYSLLVRDAAVTTWSNVATAPIDGTLRYNGIALNQPVGSDGIVATVRNDHLSRQAFDSAQIRLALATDRVQELEDFLNEIESLEDDRRSTKSFYADMFRRQLDTHIANLEREITTAETQLGVLRKIASRKASLVGTGAMSENEADEANLRVTDLEVELAALRSTLLDTRVRRQGADNGIFVTEAGTDPDWVFDSRMDLKLEKKAARLELRNARADVAEAQSALAAARADFQRLSEGAVTVPPGSVIWSRQAASAATVQAGDPIAEWLDCSVVLVDVPLIDVEIPLIRVGMEAQVLLDGEADARKGEVLLTRGSAATLGREDLAALSGNRDERHAQVLVDISAEQDTFESCPVGRIASVDFPDIGWLDIVSAWLRL